MDLGKRWAGTVTLGIAIRMLVIAQTEMYRVINVHKDGFSEGERAYLQKRYDALVKLERELIHIRTVRFNTTLGKFGRHGT